MDQVPDQISQDETAIFLLKQLNEVFRSKITSATESQLKPHVQGWIRDLTEQNEMLVRTVTELENEAAIRVSMLEEKLHSTTLSHDKILQKYKDNVLVDFVQEMCQRLEFLQNDVCNLLEFIKRARYCNNWSAVGLQFYTVDSKILQPSELSASPVELTTKMCQTNDPTHDIHNEALLRELNFQLSLKEEEINCVKNSMLKTHDSLLVKVSEKYEQNLALRKTVHALERELSEMSEAVRKRDCLIEELRTQKRENGGKDSQTLEQAVLQLEMRDRVITQLRGALTKTEEYKDKCEEMQKSMAMLQQEWDLAKLEWQTRVSANEEQIALLIKENQEIASLKKTIAELETKQFQNVDSSSLEQANCTISQQYLTISNLRDALTECKSQLEEVKRKSVSNVSVGWTSRWLGLSSSDPKSATNNKSVHEAQLEQKCAIYLKKIRQLNSLVDYLQDANLNLEINMFELVQDIAILEMQLFKYQLKTKNSSKDAHEVASAARSHEFLSNLHVGESDAVQLRKKSYGIPNELDPNHLKLSTIKEVNVLRSELIGIFHRYSLLFAKNEALNSEQMDIVHNERQSELSELRDEKTQLELKNEEHQKQIDVLQRSCTQLERDYQKAVKLIDILQNEVIDYQNNSENISGESRNVIDNVRHWLEHQAVINQQITQKFNDDQLLIHSLKQKVVELQEVKCQKEHSCRISTASVTDNEDWILLRAWLDKVNRFTRKLQASNEFWEDKKEEDSYDTQ